MKHFFVCLLLSTMAITVLAASLIDETQPVQRKRGCNIESISLAMTEEVMPSGTAAKVNLVALKPGQPYRLTCGIDANADVKMRLSLSQNTNEYDHYSVTLNDQTLQGSLEKGMEIEIHKGQNTLDMWYEKEAVSAQTMPVYLEFLNQDQQEQAKIHSCGARSVS